MLMEKENGRELFKIFYIIMENEIQSKTRRRIYREFPSKSFKSNLTFFVFSVVCINITKMRKVDIELFWWNIIFTVLGRLCFWPPKIIIHIQVYQTSKFNIIGGYFRNVFGCSKVIIFVITTVTISDFCRLVIQF